MRHGNGRSHGRAGWMLALGVTLSWLAAACGDTTPTDPAVSDPLPLLQWVGEDGDLLPDLGMARLSDLSVAKLSKGQRLLRFSMTIVNVGSGPFELNGERAGTGEASWSVVQRVFDGTGGARDVSTPVEMEFGGDGHSHWHVHDLVEATLVRLDNGAAVARGAKLGFCFWDNARYRLTLPGAPQSPVYGSAGCGRAESLEVTMGLSVGWGDLYGAWLPDQHIDISNVPSGRYRLLVIADPFGWFTESSGANNATWVDIEFRGNGNSFKVLAYGPSA